MTPWKLSLYSPQPGINPVRDWYEEQDDDAVRSAIDAAILFFRASSDWTDPFGVKVVSLKGKHLGLQEIVVTVGDLEEDGEDRQFGLIGKWKPDSNELVLFMVCNRYTDECPCLDQALEYASAWERKDPKGGVYEYTLGANVEK